MTSLGHNQVKLDLHMYRLYSVIEIVIDNISTQSPKDAKLECFWDTSVRILSKKYSKSSYEIQRVLLILNGRLNTTCSLLLGELLSAIVDDT